MARVLLAKGQPPTSVEGKSGKEYILLPGIPCKVDGEDLAHIRQKYPALKLIELNGGKKLQAGQKKNDPVTRNSSSAAMTASAEDTGATAEPEPVEPEPEDTSDGEEDDGEEDGSDGEEDSGESKSSRRKKKRKRY